ncbi:MAG: GtrA family protein [Dermatophilaceae bacterium]
MSDDRREFSAQAVRFVLAGGLNTLVTGLALSLLALVIPPQVAYPIVFLAGIVLAIYLADKMVYGVRMDLRSKLTYAALYVAVFAVGWLVMHAMLDAGMPKQYSGAVVLVTAPLTFLGGRLITNGAARRRQEAS